MKSEDPGATPILIVEDDTELAADVSRHLAQHGYAPVIANSVVEARACLSAGRPDICLVDIVMPGISGRVFCREVLERQQIPVVMMSSLSDEDTIVALLELGADDFLVKPFGMRELVARLRAVLRRRESARDTVPSQIRKVGSWTFDIVTRRLVAEDGFVRKLTPGEVGVLRFLTSSPGAVFSREDLLAVSRTRQHGGSADRSVDVLIRRIRNKVEEDPANPKHVVTIWGKGYRFDP